MRSFRAGKYFTVTKQRVQLKPTAKELAMPLDGGEKSSDIISQGTGPSPTLKVAI